MSKDIGANVPFSSADFPRLNAGNHQITSPADDLYNCIAWAAGIDYAWWEPVPRHYWPASAPRDVKLMSLIAAYESVGFFVCADGMQEEGIEKVALYADGDEYMHAARQLDTGKWTSKMGFGEDIVHDTPDDVAGPAYGQVATFMKRNRSS